MQFLLKVLIVSVFCAAIPAFAEDYVLGVKAGSSWGKSQNRTESIKSRSMLTHEVALQPGMVLGDWAIGAVLGWKFRRQLTEPREVANSNLRGSGYFFGLGGKYQWNQWGFLGEVLLSGNYRLSNLDPVGQEIKYKCPIGFCGFGFSAQTKIYQDYLIELGFKYNRWGRVDLNNNNNDISENRLREWRLYLGTGYEFSI